MQSVHLSGMDPQLHQRPFLAQSCSEPLSHPQTPALLRLCPHYTLPSRLYKPYLKFVRLIAPKTAHHLCC